MWGLPIYFFLLWFPFKGNESQQSCQSSVIKISASHRDRGIRSRSLIDTAGSDLAVSLTPRDPSRGFNDTGGSASMTYKHLHAGYRGVIETVGFDPAVSLILLDPIPRCHWERGTLSRGLIDTAESELCKRLSWISRRIRSHMRNGLKGPWGGLFDEKTRVENRVTLSLENTLFL
jgi:hypothetical protein